MKISEQWLSEWVALHESSAELAARLTMAGLEVDGVEPAAPLFSHVVVGEITACTPHPDAERLRVCEVNDGSDAPKTVVCGAPNAAVGLKAPFAQVGAKLPGDIKIKAAKLRGVKSFGMLCAARELGLSEDSAGLMALPEDAPVGKDLREWLVLDDAVFDVELTPNRSDCLSIHGVAREVGVLTNTTVQGPELSAVDATIETAYAVDVQAPSACPRYCARVVHDLDAGVPSPLWLQERLRRSGVRPVSLAVDITQYVMLELGQPMHAFDHSALNGAIQVRWAQSDEPLTLLNGETIALNSDTLVIADQAQAIALAGIMGGADSAVSTTTRTIVLESAFFAPDAIAGRARAYGLHTDASHRYERGVDPALARQAIERATALLLRYAGGKPGPITEVSAAEHLPENRRVTVRPARVNALLGTAIDVEEMRTTLARLGMPVQADSGDWQVTVPSWRFDITREVDLIEEIARVHGYDRLALRRSPAPAAIPAMPEARVALNRVRTRLVDRGYQEAITYSFIAADRQQQLDPQHAALALANPLSSDLSVMRTSLWPGLVQALQHNQNRQMPRVRLFETGLRFTGDLHAIDQQAMVAGLACGSALPEQWGVSTRGMDFFDMKGDVEALLALAGPSYDWAFVPTDHAALHPGQSAQIERNGEPVGYVGALHPGLLASLDIAGPVFAFEISQAALDDRALPAFEAVSRFPTIRRDLAIVVPEAVSAQAVKACIAKAGGAQLQALEVFDVYRGQGIQSGSKSLAIGLILQETSRTLTDQDVDAIQRQVLSALAETLGADLRE